MTPLLTAGVSGGLSLLSGLFGRSDDKKARREAMRIQEENQRRVEAMNSQQEQRVERANEISAQLGRNFAAAPMVKAGELLRDAELFGMNPIAFLRTGAASLYGKSVDLPGYQMQQVQHIASPEIFQASPLPQVRGIGSVFAGAASDAFGSYVSQDRILQQQNFQREMMSAALSGVAKGKAAGIKSAGSFLNVPGTNLAGGAITRTNPKLGAIAMPEVGEVKVTNPYSWNKVDPTVRDASAREERSGDDSPGAFLQGITVDINDAWYNYTGMTRDQRYARWGAPIMQSIRGARDWVASQFTVSQTGTSATWYPTFGFVPGSVKAGPR